MFENLSEIRRASSSAGIKTGKPKFDIRIIEDKNTFVFSIEKFAEMNIADNSLSQFIDDANGIVFLAVMPGNSGTFAKTTARGNKGKRFRNPMFIDNLIKYKYNLAEVKLHKVGDEEGKTLYQVLGNGKDIIVADTSTTPETEETVNEDEISFEERVGEPITEIEKDTDVVEEEAIEDALANDGPEKDELEF